MNSRGNIIEEDTITAVISSDDKEIRSEIGIGKDGATFTPYVDNESNLSWSNDLNLPNPPTVNIRGKRGFTFVPSVSENGLLVWSNDSNGELKNPKSVNIKGEKGDTPIIGLITLTEINKLFE